MSARSARDLYENANELLDEIVAGGLLRARGVYGFWPAAADGDDVVLANGVRFPMLRQQADHATRPNRSLADFVAPAETGLADHMGAFAVTAGIGADVLADRFAAEHDDYRSIMVKALADRLAEAFAEQLHETARREWYETSERLSKEELIAESYRGIRPAFGYPACPDHLEKLTLFDLLEAEQIGMALTESFAMTPGRASRASTSAIRPHATSRLAALPATRSRTTRPGRMHRSPRSSGGFRPVLAYDPASGVGAPVMEHNFGTSRRFSLGVEEEFQLVGPRATSSSRGSTRSSPRSRTRRSTTAG